MGRTSSCHVAVLTSMYNTPHYCPLTCVMYLCYCCAGAAHGVRTSGTAVASARWSTGKATRKCATSSARPTRHRNNEPHAHTRIRMIVACSSSGTRPQAPHSMGHTDIHSGGCVHTRVVVPCACLQTQRILSQRILSPRGAYFSPFNYWSEGFL